MSTPASPTSDDKTFAVLAHIGGIVLGFIPSLVLWLVKKDDGDTFAVRQSKEALNFQISVLIGYVVCAALTLILIGILLFWILWLVNVVFCIIAAVKASNGEEYRYPLTLRLIN